MSVRVLLVDDQHLVRAGLTRILASAGGMEVVGEAEDGDQVAEAVRSCRPDVVVMDVRMKRVDGAEATRRLRADPGSPPVLALTTFDDDETVAAALGAGAAGFVLKDAPGEDIIRAVQVVAGGGVWLDPQVAGRVLSVYRASGPRDTEARARLASLTERERDVLRLMGRGLSNREITDALFIGEGTVKTHVGRILSKLHLRDRAAAIVLAFDQGLVNPGEQI